jgi:TRAP-type C4-dicarboxylate transport system permease small subunit
MDRLDKIERVFGAITKYLDYVGRIGFFALMALVTINVILRYVWVSISGAYDYVQVLTAISVAAAIAFTAYERGNIEIELLMERFSERVQGVMACIMTLISLVFFAMASWWVITLGHDMQVAGETTMTVYMPYAPFLYFIAAGLALMVLALLGQFIRQLHRVIDPSASEPPRAASGETPPEVLTP